MKSETDSDDVESSSEEETPVAIQDYYTPMFSPSKSGSSSKKAQGEKKKRSASPALGKKKKRSASPALGKKKKRRVSPKQPNPFERKWSEEEEIILLQALIDFKKEKGKSAYEDLNGFLQSVKGLFSFEVSKTKVLEKIRNLRKKFRGKEEKSYSEKPHGQKCLSLLHQLCATDEVFAAKFSEKIGTNKAEQDGFDFENSSFVGSIGIDREYFKQKWRLVPRDDQKKFEQEFMDLMKEENELAMHKFRVEMLKAKMKMDLTSLLHSI